MQWCCHMDMYVRWRFLPSLLRGYRLHACIRLMLSPGACTAWCALQASCALLDLVQRHISRPVASNTAAAGADAFDSTANGYHAASGTRLLMITQQQLTGLHGAFLINVSYSCCCCSCSCA